MNSVSPRRSPLPFALTVMFMVALGGRVPAQTPGDVNGDGSVTVRDVALLMDHLLGRVPMMGGTLDRADANRDGAVDAADLAAIHASPLPPSKVFMLPGGAALTLVKIPRGTFLMGSPQSEVDADRALLWELPRHTVTIGYDFYVGMYETTQRQWTAVMGENPSYYSPSNPRGGEEITLDNPVERVSWNDVMTAFLPAINGLGLGGTFRLPSESEWEYAARAGTQTRFSFGDSTCAIQANGGCDIDCDLDDYAWWCGTSSTVSGHRPVGRKRPNAYGLFDMAGNVDEYCSDHSHIDYTGAPADGSAWIVPAGEYRLIRGGSWYDVARNCRPAARNLRDPDNRNSAAGFRIVWTP